MDSAGTFNKLPTAAQQKAKQLLKEKQFRKSCMNMIILGIVLFILFMLWRNQYGQEISSFD